MNPDAHTGTDVLLRMLLDILSEADVVRWSDPVKAAYLDDAASDLRAVIAETDEVAKARLRALARAPEALDRDRFARL